MPESPDRTLSAASPVALVTGASRRIGRAIAEDLAAHGFAVAIHCFGSRDEAEEVAASISMQGGRARVFEADLTEVDEAEALIPSVVAEFGAPSLLVNNASIFEPDELATFTWERWQEHFSLHLMAPIALSRAFASALGERDGLIVNIIDQRVLKPTPRYFTYSLSKSALWDATRTMAQALAPNIRANAIGPGPTLPNLRQSDADFSAQVSALLLERGPALAEFGETIRYLWAARSVTGQMIALDGGQHLAWRTPDVTGAGE